MGLSIEKHHLACVAQIPGIYSHGARIDVYAVVGADPDSHLVGLGLWG